MDMMSARVQHPNVHLGSSRGLTVLLFGAPGTWKTTWCAQWPGVVFINIASEGGDDALQDYPKIAQHLLDNAPTKEIPPVFNAQMPPKFDVYTCEQFVEYCDLIVKNRKAWGVCTVVIDGLFQLIDLWKHQFIAGKERQSSYKRQVERMGGDLIDQQAWGFLNLFLSKARVNMQNHGLNVIWTTLLKEVWEGDQLVAEYPLIQGQNRVTLPAQCKLWVYAKYEKTPDMNVPGTYKAQPRYMTKSTSTVNLRHKYYTRFPQGCLIDPDYGSLPTFRALYYELHDVIYLGQ